MIAELTKVLLKEKEELKGLLELLEKQHKLIISKNVFALEGVVEEIKVKNKEVAESEIARRRLIGNNSMKEFMNKFNNEELDSVYRKIGKLLNEVVLQKDTNELLIKQQLIFTNRMLNLINPKRDIPTYNSYGNIKR